MEGIRALKRVAFVTTANRAIGSGHLRRCLTLAEELADRGAACSFAVYAGDPAFLPWLRSADRADVRPELTLDDALDHAARQAPVAVVDSYDVQAGALRRLLDAGCRVLVMDDLVDRPLPATWLLNSCEPEESRAYDSWTNARLLLGPRYALLRSQFRNLPAREATERATRVLVTIGGTDPLRQGERVLSALGQLPGRLQIRYIQGALAPDMRSVAGPHSVEVLKDVQDMAGPMMWADVAVSGAGQTLFELAAAGCPALAIRVADNQRRSGALFERIGSAVVLAVSASDEAFLGRLSGLILDRTARERMSRAGRAAVDGRGAERVADALLEAA